MSHSQPKNPRDAGCQPPSKSRAATGADTDIGACEYAELHCLSNFSFLRGASHPGELVERAAALGYTALALSDECSLGGVVRAHVAAREHGLKLIVGAEFQLDDGPKLVLLATNREAYGGLSQLITHARRRAGKGRYFIQRADFPGPEVIPDKTPLKILGLDQCLALLIAQHDTHEADVRWLAGCFPGRAWLAVALHHGPDDRAWLQRLRELGVRAGLPLVATGDVHMHSRSRRPLQDALCAIRLGTTVARAGHALFPNGERHLRPRKRLARIYPPDLLRETTRIAALCDFSLDELRYAYPLDCVPEGESADGYLRRLTQAGMRKRWPRGAPDKVRALIRHELRIIAELRYEPYFLTVYDIVRFAKSRGILCQGRGSAANSAVCYCLGITAVDPSRMQMLFERFVSKERGEPPDIDVDFEHERREEVIQYIYQRYGRERAALAATVICYRRRSALRDAGKAMGMDLDQVDRLSRAFAWWDKDALAAGRVQEAGFDADNPLLRRVLYLANELLGFPRHLSQHVGGFLIAQGPVSRLVPIENAAMPERTIIQWDKDDLDAMGLLKVDCLALGMLSAIHRAFDLIHLHRGRRFTLANIPAEDAAVYEMIQRADTVGVFQIESRAQMSMLPRLKPANFYDLVIEVAIVRPGPIQGEMVHPYLRRRQGLEAITYPSEQVRDVLQRTLGVPIFQEQVIKLAMVAAGFSAGEADQLRRAIGSWRKREKLSHFQQRLADGMRTRGYPEAFARQIFQQIQGFGEYGFPESHAASFALLVYVSCWLKHHEPAAYTCALLNSQPMGFYAPAQLVQDARRHGVQVRELDVRHSDWDCTLEPGKQGLALRLGLRMVRGLSHAGAARLLALRESRGIDAIQQLIRHAALNNKDVDALSDAGAFNGLAGDRHRARWHASGTETTLPLFGDNDIEADIPALPVPSEADDILADYASLGLSLKRHPLALLREQLRDKRFVTASQIQQLRDGQHIRTAGLVITRQRPASASGVIFVTLEDETGSVNIICWNQIIEKQRRELLGAKLLGVHGRLQREGEVIHIIAGRLEDHTALLGELHSVSRDFR